MTNQYSILCDNSNLQWETTQQIRTFGSFDSSSGPLQRQYYRTRSYDLEMAFDTWFLELHGTTRWMNTKTIQQEEWNWRKQSTVTSGLVPARLVSWRREVWWRMVLFALWNWRYTDEWLVSRSTCSIWPESRNGEGIGLFSSRNWRWSYLSHWSACVRIRVLLL